MTPPAQAHRWLGLVWKPDGQTPTHRVRCLCGWISTTDGVGYGYPISHEDDYERHVQDEIASEETS